MLQRRRLQHQLRLYAYGLFCAFLASGCSTPSGNYDLGRADAQIGGLISDHPGLKSELEKIRENIRQAELALQGKQETIDNLSKAVTRAQEKADSRLATIWKLTSGLLGILVVVGGFLAWKLK